MPLFAFTVFISAFLLFLVQPIIVKSILPWYGGTATVWVVCLLFFQITLLCGYLYAHLIRTLVTPKHQIIIHGCLILCACLFLPIIPDLNLRPLTVDNPVYDIWTLLIITLGVPFLLVSASGPLLQYWFSEVYPKTNSYRLYAVSNTGSLLALLIYPFVMEPMLSLYSQAWLWSSLFLIYIVVCGLCMHLFFKIKGGAVPVDAQFEKFSKSPLTDRVLWVLLSASASVLLLASTNQICQDVASVPFLWILPLVLYLLSFIICFDKSKWYDRRVWTPLFFLSIAFGLYAILRGSILSIILQVVAYLTVLFTGCMVCHGEVVRIKPHQSQLTGFYLYIALGGALGGIFVTLIAPAIFKGYWELQLIWCVIFILYGYCLFRNNAIISYSRRIALQFCWVLFCGFLALVLIGQIDNWHKNVIAVERNFYGVLRVVEYKDAEEKEPQKRILFNGSIIHGNQLVNNATARLMPTTYYGKNSGVGLAILGHPKHKIFLSNEEQFRIAVIGMGAATISALANTDDFIRFYEINPQVVSFAKKYFTFLDDTSAQWEVKLGDARTSLEFEDVGSDNPAFDVIAVDAFTGDSIPVHLLTIEAFELYWLHLNEDGILVVHTSNRHLRLESIVKLAAERLNKQVFIVANEGEGERATDDSTWVLMTNNEEFLRENKTKVIDSIDKQESKSLNMWTDNYSNLFDVLQ